MTGFIRPYQGITPKIHPEAFIAENAVIIGDVEIGAGSSIWYNCVLRGDVNKIRVGRNTNIQDGTVVHCNHDRSGRSYRESGGGDPCFIGDNVVIGHMALIHACTLDSDCFIGMNAVVMDRAVVEARAMVAAGALVSPRKVVLSGQLWGGRPARFMRELKPEEQEMGPYIARTYTALGASYRSDDDL